MADEPGWFFPDAWSSAGNSPAALARLASDYQSFLSSRGFPDAAARGLTPIGRASALDAAPLAQRQQFFWTANFFADEAARAAKRYTTSVLGAFPQAFNLVNWSPNPARYVQSMRSSGINSVDDAWAGMDWFTSGRTSAHGLWSEDWVTDSSSHLWAMNVNMLRSAAAMGTQGLGGYVVGSMLGPRSEGASYRILSLIGRGAKIVDVYAFGPAYLWDPANAWSDNEAAYGSIANAFRRVGRAESLLYPGVAPGAPGAALPRPQVALQLPGAGALWFPISAGCATSPSAATCSAGNWERASFESQGLYLALMHAGYDVDFVDDVDLATKGLLASRGYRVVYVTSPNLSQTAQQEISSWVAGGGTLVASPGAGLWDEYNTPCTAGTTALLDTLGLRPPSLDASSPWSHLRNQPSALVSTIEGHASGSVDAALYADLAPVDGARPYSLPPGTARIFAAPLSPVDPSDVVAQFKGPNAGALQAAAAVTVHRHGAGTAIAYGFLPGVEYYISQNPVAGDRLPADWDQAARARAVAPVVQAPSPVQRTVYADVPLVQALRLDSAAGTAVVLLNWNDWLPGDESLPVTVFVAGAGGRKVASVEGNPVHAQTVGADLKVTLAMKNVDILKLTGR